MTYPMPEGVEHIDAGASWWALLDVMTYPMPEGVEHCTIPLFSTNAACDDLSDAGRR